MRASTAIRSGVLSLALLALAPGARAVTVTVDYDHAALKDLVTAPYYEKGVVTTVDTGHYDLLADATGSTGDLAFNLDDETGLARVTITAQGLMFDALSLDVVNPADAATGESYTISAVGGGGGSMPVPGTLGPIAFGPGFQGMTALGT